MIRKESFLRDYEKKLDRAINQIELGMWYEHTERDGHAIVVCHSPTGHDYELNPACMSCSCPDTTRVHGLCKHIIGYDVWLKCHPPKLYQRVAQSTADRELFRKKDLVISLDKGRMVYQNGRTVTSDPVVDSSGRLVPDFKAKYDQWSEACHAKPL